MESVLEPNVYGIVVKDEVFKVLNREEGIIKNNVEKDAEEVIIYIESLSDHPETDFQQNGSLDDLESHNKNDFNSTMQKYTENNAENMNIQEERDNQPESENHKKNGLNTMCHKYSEAYDYYDYQYGFDLRKYKRLSIEKCYVYKNYACNICNYQSASKSKIYEHMWGHSQQNIPLFPCDICGKKFSDIMLKCHQLEHKYNNSLICTECGKRLSNFIKLDKHMQDHTSKEISCIFCDNTFQFRAEYNKHMEFYHIDKYGTISPAINLVPNFCTCQICFKIFPQKSGLNEHMKIHSEEKRCPKCNYTSKIKAQLEIHIASLCDTVQAFKCKECGKQFSSKPFLKRHMIIHSNEKPYECTECHFKSSHSQSLRSHLRKVHNKRDEDIYQFHCSECDKMFASMGELQLHMKNKKCEFKCLHCAFICRSSKEMKKHRKNKHYTKRNIDCPECARKFQSNWRLEKHITAIHDGEKPHQCNYCNKSFGFKASLQKHLKTLHKDNICNKCEKCDYKAVTEHNLKVHIIRKHGDNPLFHCTHCDFKCKYNHIFKKHIENWHPAEHNTSRNKRSENVFQCPDCNKPFNNRIRLKEHYLLEHL